MLSDRDKLQSQIDAFFASNEQVGERNGTPLTYLAKRGWAQPDALSLEEIQDLCKAVVIASANAGSRAALRG